MSVLIDSSIWIAAQEKDGREFAALSRLLRSDEQILTCVIIQTEVAKRAVSEGAFQELWDGFLGLEFLKIENEHWDRSARNYFRCRKRGITPSTTDCMIATLAADYGASLWTNNLIMLSMQPIVGFDVAGSADWNAFNVQNASEYSRDS